MLLVRDSRVYTLALRDATPPNALNALQVSGAATYFTETIDIGTFVEGILFLILANQGGTNPTFDCKVQYSADKINWIDSGDAFAQQAPGTNGAVVIKKLTANFGKYIRCLIAIGGTATPGYKVTLQAVLKG